MTRLQRLSRSRKPCATFVGKRGVKRAAFDNAMFERAAFQWLQRILQDCFAQAMADARHAEALFAAAIRMHGCNSSDSRIIKRVHRWAAKA